MKVNEYQELAMTTLNPELSRRDVLINSVMGLCGESGEAIDIVKKWMAQGHELDKAHLAKELGDIAWYLAEAATALDIPLEDILQAKTQTKSPYRRCDTGFYILFTGNYTSSMIAISAASPRRAPVRVTLV